MYIFPSLKWPMWLLGPFRTFFFSKVFWLVIQMRASVWNHINISFVPLSFFSGCDLISLRAKKNQFDLNKNSSIIVCVFCFFFVMSNIFLRWEQGLEPPLTGWWRKFNLSLKNNRIMLINGRDIVYANGLGGLKAHQLMEL